MNAQVFAAARHIETETKTDRVPTYSQSRLLMYAVVTVVLATCPALAAAQSGSPFDTGFTSLQNLFTGTIAKVASLIAIVVGGYEFAHGEPGAKRSIQAANRSMFCCRCAISVSGSSAMSCWNLLPLRSRKRTRSSCRKRVRVQTVRSAQAITRYCLMVSAQITIPAPIRRVIRQRSRRTCNR